MNDLEEKLFKSKNLEADNDYIYDGVIIVAKDFINNKVLRNFNTNKNFMSKIPYEKGEEFVIKNYSKAVLLPNKRIGIKYDEDYYFDYELVKSFYDYFLYYSIYTTVAKAPKLLGFENVPVLKFFADGDKFIGAILPFRQRIK